MDAPKVGRKARRVGTDEAVAEATPVEFPRKGIRGTAFEPIARAALPAPICDLDLVAGDFTRWAEDSNKPLRGPAVTAIFAGFCRAQKPAG